MEVVSVWEEVAIGQHLIPNISLDGERKLDVIGKWHKEKRNAFVKR